MKTLVCVVWCSAFSLSLIADMFVEFFVRDASGRPVINAIVDAKVLDARHLNAGVRESDYTHSFARTDETGLARVEIRTDVSRMKWQVSASGYYDKMWDDLTCREEDAQGRRIGRSKSLPKSVTVTMYRKLNPIPAYAYYSYRWKKIPEGSGEFGFDLMLGDWVSPFGLGQVVDLTLVKHRLEYSGKVGYSGSLRFADGCGFHTYKKTGCKEFPSTYAAETNVTYECEKFCTTEVKDGERLVALKYQDPIADDEFWIVRTRVKKNKNGDVVSANYAKVLGPVCVGGYLDMREVVFNPIPNDVNLELDPSQNMIESHRSSGLAP